MTTISEPYIDLTITGQPTPTNVPQKVLFVGQMLSGTATSGDLVQNIGVSGEENALFGRTSFIAGMIRAARKLNKVTQFDAIPLSDNGAGTAAAGIIAFSGTATLAGTLKISIGSKINHQYLVAVSIGDTATTVGANLVTAITADTTAPFSAANVTGTVTITCRHKGTLGNKIGIIVENAVAGITETVTAFTGGATDPVLTAIFDPIENIRYQTVVWPSTYSKSTVINFLDARFNVANSPLDGVAITHNTDSYANHITALNALNSKSLVYFCNKTIVDTLFKGSSLFELDDEVASQFAANRSLRLTTNADISGIVNGGTGQQDAFGGISLASLPYANTPFPNLPLTDQSVGFSSFEMTNLNASGGSLIGNNPANNGVVCGRVLTTYKTDSAANVDTTFQFLNDVDTSSVSREYFYVNLRALYAMCRLTTGALESGFKMVNATSFAGSVVGLFQKLGKLALVEAGPEALTAFRNSLVVTIVDKNTISFSCRISPVGQVRNILADIVIVFQNFGQ